jgi:hypothetical protein
MGTNVQCRIEIKKMRRGEEEKRKGAVVAPTK